MKTLLPVLFLFFTIALDAQQKATSLFEKLTAVEAAKVELETNFDDIQDNRKTEEQFPGILTLKDGSTFKVNLSVRGKFRRMSNKYPPLKVKVPKKALAAAGLDTLNEFKFLFPFDDTDPSGDWVVKEYLAYKMFESVSPNNIHARLLQLTLKDSRTGKTNALFCLAVEDKEQTLARLHGTFVETYGITDEQLDTDQYALMAVFQYMIGNTDWQVSTFRNVRLLQTPGSDKLSVLPYDLDFSGMVNASYARPSMDYALKSVTDRYFMAQNLDPEKVRNAVKKFVQARDELYALCRSPYLTKKASKEMSNYLDSFFNQITPGGDLLFGATPVQAGANGVK